MIAQADFSLLSKCNANIVVQTICNHPWMMAFGPVNATHRLLVIFTVKCVEYEWRQVFNDKVISLQGMLRLVIKAIKIKEA